jgi:hypothetical protein
MISISEFINAQLIIKGVVKNEKDIPVPYVLIKGSDKNSAVFSDSIGQFTINITPGSSLYVSAQGYKNEIVKVGESNNFQIVLKYAEKENSTGNNSSVDYTSRDAFSGQTNTVSAYNSSSQTEGGEIAFNGGGFPIAREKEVTHGSRYLYKDWKQGVVINSKGTEINNPSYFYNYDKSEGNLLLSHDKQNAIIVDKDQVKSFTIYNDLNEPNSFEMVPAIDGNRFVQLISGGNKYRIYKLTKTKIVKASYSTNGLVSSGNPYDEYVDDNTYFVLDVQKNNVDKIVLKKKSIKSAFSQDNDKVNTFFNEHGGDAIDDNFLKNLGNYLNN